MSRTRMCDLPFDKCDLPLNKKEMNKETLDSLYDPYAEIIIHFTNEQHNNFLNDCIHFGIFISELNRNMNMNPFDRDQDFDPAEVVSKSKILYDTIQKKYFPSIPDDLYQFHRYKSYSMTIAGHMQNCHLINIIFIKKKLDAGILKIDDFDICSAFIIERFFLSSAVSEKRNDLEKDDLYHLCRYHSDLFPEFTKNILDELYSIDLNFSFLNILKEGIANEKQT